MLFIVIDDLRPELGAYGQAHVKSPRIDQLASEGILFEHAYAQQSTCLPSRTSVLTGLRPESAGVSRFESHFREHVPDVVTLPQHFKANGYRTVGLGKVFHLGRNDPQSWSRSVERPNVHPYQSPENQALVARKLESARAKGIAGTELVRASRGPAFEAFAGHDSSYIDGVITRLAIMEMRSKGNEPLFLAVGYLKPHLPFVAPKRYWDLYDPEAIPLATNPGSPTSVPPFALHESPELRSYDGIPASGPIGDDLARRTIHGYLACTSYIDAQVGLLLDTLHRLGRRDNTIVVLWGDHGWHLGEHGMWGKFTNFEEGVRSPLIISTPASRSGGRKTSALVELVDLYPTITELAGLPLPAHLEGISLVPLLERPTRAWKNAAFSQFPRGAVMGRSIRTDRYRLTRWTRGSRLEGVELYDHRADPEENENLAHGGSHDAVVRSLTSQLKQRWTTAAPPATEGAPGQRPSGP